MQRTRLVINVGNLIEAAGAAAGVVGLARVAGLGYGLLLLAVLLIVAAELVYDAHVWRVALPRRPRPRALIVRKREDWRWWRLQRRARRACRAGS